MLLLMVGLTACTTGAHPGSRTRREDPDRERYQFVLYRVGIDRKAVDQGASLLFTEPPPGFGARRRSQGFFSLTDEGFCRVDVRVGESFVGVDGRRVEHSYNLVSFYGRMNGDRTLATVTSGESPTVTPTGQVDRITLRWSGRDKVSIQAHAGSRAQAYTFDFHDHRVMDRNVAFPH